MTHESALEHEATLHRRYFEPFDKLLERKAQYYLEKTEKDGKESPMLLKEIEILERFRQYVSILETMAQEQMEIQYKMARSSEYWKNRWKNAAWWQKIWRELYECKERDILHLNLKIKRLQEQCQQP